MGDPQEDPREGLDQCRDSTSRTRTGQRKKDKRERGEVYLSRAEQQKKSMSTAMNYDKCRDCDAAISVVPLPTYIVSIVLQRGPSLTRFALPDIPRDTRDTYIQKCCWFANFSIYMREQFVDEREYRVQHLRVFEGIIRWRKGGET